MTRPSYPAYEGSAPSPGPEDAPAPTTAGDFDRLVHVSERAGPRPVHGMLNGPGFRVSSCVTGVVLAIVGVAGAVSGAPTLALLIAVSGAAGLSGIASACLRRRESAPMPDDVAARLAPCPDDRFRLRLIAPRNVAAFFRDVGDEPFEPRIFPLLTAPVLITAARRRRIGATIFLLWAAMLVAPLLVAKRGDAFAMCFMIASMGAPAALFGAALWPSYLRVAPGRLDVLGYGLLGRGKPLVISINLRTARLIVDLPLDLLRIEREGKGMVGITFSGITQRLEFAKVVLHAARCTTPAPPLPDDELVG